MSKNARIFGINENTNDMKVPAEVTIARQRPATVSTESNTSNRVPSRSIKILSRIEEQQGNHYDPRTPGNSDRNINCLRKLDAASPENSFDNCEQRESNKFKSHSLEHREDNELKALYKNQSASAATHSIGIAGLKNVSEDKGHRRGPLVELSALHKVLDRLKPDDIESTGAWYSSESCCREIVLRFQNLLSEWSSDLKRLDDRLFVDDTLRKCEHCGVIRCREIPRNQESLSDKIHNEHVTIAEREIDATSKTAASPIVKPVKKSVEVMINSCPVMPSRCRSDAMTPRGKLPMGKIDSNAVAKKKFAKVTNDKKIVNRSCEKNSVRSKKIVNCEDSCDPQGGKTSKCMDNTFLYGETKYLETVKYLARGNFVTVKNNKSQDSLRENLPNDFETPKFRKSLAHGKNSFALHGSRDIDIHHNSQFLLCDRLKFPDDQPNPETHIDREEIDKSKTDTSNLSDDSAAFSEPCDVQLKESNTSTFSSSSAENLIRKWIKRSKNVSKTNVERVKESARQDSAVGAPLRNVQSIRTRITDAIQKFANRSDDFITAKPDASCEKKNSEDISTMKSDRKIIASDSRNKNSTGLSSSSILSVMSSENLENQFLSAVPSERFERQILYDEVSSRDTISESSIKAVESKVLPMYRKILESNEEMDWKSFERLVAVLHPCQRELWCDICRAVSAEAKRVADETGATTEVCIEVNPLPCESERPIVRSRGNEITFELDMIVKDVDALLEMNEASALPKKANKEKKQSSESD